MLATKQLMNKDKVRIIILTQQLCIFVIRINICFVRKIYLTLCKYQVWNVKLAEKDMEIKRLKDMTEKQDKVRLQREKMLTSKSNNANSGQGGASSGNALFRHGKSGLLKPNAEESVGNDKAIELQDWIEKEIYTQSQRNVLQENIQLQVLFVTIACT